MSKVTPTEEQLQWLQETITSAFKKVYGEDATYVAYGCHVDGNISTLCVYGTIGNLAFATANALNGNDELQLAVKTALDFLELRA